MTDQLPSKEQNPFDKARAVFAGKKADGYLLKLWFDTQEDLDAAFDAVEGTSQPPVDGWDANGSPVTE